MHETKRKKTISFILTILLMLMMMPQNVVGAPVFADTTTETMDFFTLSPDGKTIVAFNYIAEVSPREIIIPAKINGIELEAIGDSAFSGCGLMKIEFEQGSKIKRIGKEAFSSNPFTEFVLPETVKEIGEGAFAACANLTAIDLNHLTLTTIPEDCFLHCTSLVKVTLPESLTIIGEGAFYDCPLNGIMIPSSVTEIKGLTTFYGMQSNSIVDLSNHAPGSIKGAPWFAIHGILRWDNSEQNNSSVFIFNQTTGEICGLKENYLGSGNLVIPEKIAGVTVKGLADGVFGSRPANQVVKTVRFEPNLSFTEIPNNAFLGASQLTKITNMPETIEKIGSYAFRACSSLTEITLPKAVKTVGYWAFQGCTGLNTVIFSGEEITAINAQAFYGIKDGLTDIYLKEKDKGTVANEPWAANYARIHWKDTDSIAKVCIDDSKQWAFIPSSGEIVEYVGNITANSDMIIPNLLSYEGQYYQITHVGGNSLPVIPAQATLNSLTFSSGIKIIDVFAFNSVKIDTLELCDSIEHIRAFAFANCGLQSLNLPDAVTYIGPNAFFNNEIKGELVIPGNVRTVFPNAFAQNPEINQLMIKQYRNQREESIYNPFQSQYFVLPDEVKNNAPFGAWAAANRVLYLDELIPLYEHEVIPKVINSAKDYCRMFQVKLPQKDDPTR